MTAQLVNDIVKSEKLRGILSILMPRIKKYIIL